MSDATEVVARFYAAEAGYMNAAEAGYMNAGGAAGGAAGAAWPAPLDPEVVLHQSPDLPWGGEFRGHAGYEDWARQMSAAFDRLEVKDARTFVDGDTVVITCRLVTRSRRTGETLDLPMVQVVRVRGARIVEFRPFYWNVPLYVQATQG